MEDRELIRRIEIEAEKPVRAIRRDYCTFSLRKLFQDGTEGMIKEGDMIFGGIKIYDVPKSFCVSCGEDMHGASEFDSLGRCYVSREKFWGKVRRLFWHRYSKSK